MIIKETVTIDGRVFTHTYSNTYKIRKIGTDGIYTDAMDVLDFEYEETDTLIPDESTTPEQMQEALGIELDEGYFNIAQERIQAAQAAKEG
jgi:hypothetical protein